MVYGLMIHSVDSSQTLHFSIFYTPEGNDGHKKTRQQTIMRRILEEHLFQTHSGEQAGLTKSKASSSLDDADWLFRFASASNFLTLFVHELNDHFRKGGGVIEEVASRPDEVLTILNFLLPGGQLLFINFNMYIGGP
ncbi:unnamed protein product [Prorocentrum cordatum]|uniref:Uncharacterized protein n=1 Tax=Prorocentrum cordatum TaxID=2364126 RepID=A0ABN9WBL6_9DINO|nr:unnamed protein product [Polarella glacialis]